MRSYGFLAPALLVAAPAWAQASVEGAITYDAQRVAMTQVHARETRGLPESAGPPRIVVLVTDRPPPAKVIASRQAYYAAARAGEVRGLLLTIEDGQRARLSIFAPGGAHDDTFVPDVFGSLELVGLAREGGTVSGRLRTKEPREFVLDADSPATPRAYALDLTFRVPVTPSPKPTQVLTGEAARASEPVAAALRSLQLIASGSTAELAAMIAPDHPAFAGLEGPEGQSVLAMARTLLPAPATFNQSVERVVLYGDEAVVVARDEEGSTSVSLRRHGGRWKLAPSPLPND